jgi:plasmid maintenance system antidote protein VapI
VISSLSSGLIAKTIYNTQVLKNKAAAMIANKAAITANTAESLKKKKEEGMRKRIEIQKQKQLLLEKQLQQQKILITKLENKKLKPEEKSTIITVRFLLILTELYWYKFLIRESMAWLSQDAHKIQLSHKTISRRA